MASPGDRRPNRALWLILGSGALLALLGVRAVLSEWDRARLEAERDARAVAQRLADAFAALVREQAEPLPAQYARVSHAEARESVRHLHPTWAITPEGKEIDLEPREEVSRDTSAADRRVLASALELAASDERTDEAAATLLAASAELVEDASVAGRLRYEAARHDLEAGDLAAALRMLGHILTGPPGILDPAPTPESTTFGSIYASAAFTALELLDRDDAQGLPPPTWLVEAHEGLAENPRSIDPAIRTELLRRLETHMSEDQLATARRNRVRSEGLRHAAAETADQPEVRVRLTQQYGGIQIEKQVALFEEWRGASVWLGGEIPASVVKRRLWPIAEHAADERVGAVSIVDPNGVAVLWTESYEGDLWGVNPSVQVTPVLFPTAQNGPDGLADFTVHAAAVRHVLPPRSAIWLGGALVLLSAALVWGALALSRVAADHARLAEERRQFLDHVAHEVRTPTAAVLALSEELAAAEMTEDRREQYATHLVEESKRLAALVEETLDLSRLESGRLVAKREPLDLRDVASDAVADVGASAGRVVIDVPDEPVPVVGDNRALRRAIRNLVSNAITHGASDAPAEVRVVGVGDMARVEVRDHGPGVRPAYGDRVFERFFRVHTTTHEVKGVGLGLALVREVAQAHGGEARLESPPGGGAQFVLEIPREEAST